MSTKTADEMNLMLRGVVTGGTGTLAKVDGYTVLGKTGTAREPQPNGGYTDTLGRYHYDATFVGVVPAQKPALSVIVVIDDPTGRQLLRRVGGGPGLRQDRVLRPAPVPRPASVERRRRRRHADPRCRCGRRRAVR